jgi:LPXTG-site transpeptidase (sortase) family protein
MAEARIGATAPVRVVVESLGIDSDLLQLGLNSDGTLQVPRASQGMKAGWYTGSAVPGQPGAAVIVGHNATRFGPAAFARLHRIRPHDRIVVVLSDGQKVTFAVTSIEEVKKSEFPTGRVYDPTVDAQLRLVTCIGPYNSEGHALDSLIVYAVKV